MCKSYLSDLRAHHVVDSFPKPSPSIVTRVHAPVLLPRIFYKYVSKVPTTSTGCMTLQRPAQPRPAAESQLPPGHRPRPGNSKILPLSGKPFTVVTVFVLHACQSLASQVEPHPRWLKPEEASPCCSSAYSVPEENPTREKKTHKTT